MSDHRIKGMASPDGHVVFACVCQPSTGLVLILQGQEFTLDELNKIAHEHIESSERDSEADDVISGSRDYRAESLVTSNDQLVDLAGEWSKTGRWAQEPKDLRQTD